MAANLIIPVGKAAAQWVAQQSALLAADPAKA